MTQDRHNEPHAKQDAHHAPPDAQIAAAFRCLLDRPRILSSAELRRLDRDATSILGLPSILLMENASRGVAAVAIEMIAESIDPAVLVVAGPGNNGGDGLAVARHLHIQGVRVAVALAADPAALSPDAAANLAALGHTPIPVHTLPLPSPHAGATLSAIIDRVRPDLVLDALLGTGLSRPPAGRIRDAIIAINTARAEQRTRAVLSVDLPSGLDADTGAHAAQAVRADATATLAALKPAFFTIEAQPCIGGVTLLPIGIPPELIRPLGRPYDPPPRTHARADLPGVTAHTPPAAPGRGETGRAGHPR